MSRDAEATQCYALADGRLEVVEGDITEQRVDAIVNAANSGLRGGGGVDGAIHDAGGPSILAECRKLGRCLSVGAVVTGAGNLSARYVIHAVGPIWQGGSYDEPALLARAYSACMARARELEIDSIAFPSLSTGAYRFPLELAAPIALRTLARAMPGSGLTLVRMVLFGPAATDAYRRAAASALAIE